MYEARKALIRSIRLTLSSLSCLDSSKPTPSPPPTKIHVSSVLDPDAVSRKYLSLIPRECKLVYIEHANFLYKYVFTISFSFSNITFFPFFFNCTAVFNFIFLGWHFIYVLDFIFLNICTRIAIFFACEFLIHIKNLERITGDYHSK